MTSKPSSTISLPDPGSNLPNETHHLKERLYGEYLDQEREERQLRNEVKRKAVHKSLDLPMEDPLQITNTTTHNHYGEDEKQSSVQQTLSRLEQQVQSMSKQPMKVIKKAASPSLLSKALPLLLAGGLGATGVGLPIAGMLAYNFLSPYIGDILGGGHSAIPSPQEAKQSSIPNAILEQELRDMKALIDEMKNKKYIVKHFRKGADGTLQEVPVAPLQEAPDGSKPE